MDNQSDVTELDPSTSASEPQSVTGGLPQDRPVQNVVGEFNRKMGTIEARLDQLTNALSAALTPKAPEPPKGSRESLSNDDLWELAKAGDKSAFDEHQRRQAAQVYSELRGRENDAALTEGQMIALRNKYPVLANPQHPLTQTASQAYHLLVRRGRPANLDTLLDATKTAIADRPDLIAEMHTQTPRAREQARQRSAQNTGTGASYRNDEPAQERVRFGLTDEEKRLAQRMNITEPLKAKERFMKRQAEGKSTFGAVANQIDMENW